MEANIKFNLISTSTEGNLTYNYRPFRNYVSSTNQDESGLSLNQIKYRNKVYTLYHDNTGDYIYYNGYKKYIVNEKIDDYPITRFSGNVINYGNSVIDLDTECLNFSLNHPVDIEVLDSYDGSVNLILNDGFNKPRLINSRFSPTSLTRYKIVDRLGDKDTNIYNKETFDIDTSLYKLWKNIPKIEYNGLLYGGNLKVGNYTFYFKYVDADDNETDFIAQSSIVSIFKGNDGDPFSIDGGYKNMNSLKGVQFTINNIDKSYDYLRIYYTRSYADLQQNRVVSAYKIEKKYTLHTNITSITVFGNEETTEIPVSDLNLRYFVANRANTQTQCQNRLFLGGVAKPKIPYEELTDIALRILPTVKRINSEDLIGHVNYDYQTSPSGSEYYSTKNIYNYVGYWPEEIYRFGVVFILSDNTYTSTFNIRGIDFNLSDEFSEHPFVISDSRNFIKSNEETCLIYGGENNLENNKGIIRFPKEINKINQIYSINFSISNEILSYLKNELHIKGLFFVRQKRIPTILAQGLTIPIDHLSHVPLLDYSLHEKLLYGELYIIPEQNKYIEKTSKYAFELFFSKNPEYRKDNKEYHYLTNDYAERLKGYGIIGEVGPGTTENLDKERIALYNLEKSNPNVNLGIVCPEFELNLPYYNQFFTGSSYYFSPITKSLKLQNSNILRMYYYKSIINRYIKNNKIESSDDLISCKIVSVTENVPKVAINKTIYQLHAGEPEDVSKFEWVGANFNSYAEETGKMGKTDAKSTRFPNYIVRGSYGPYLGVSCSNEEKYVGLIVNIYIANYNTSNMFWYFLQRIQDDSAYYPISEFYSFDEVYQQWLNDGQIYNLNCFRGDSFINTYTWRMNRNFNDPSSPSNDKIIDDDTWCKNYGDGKRENFFKMNRGDINAVMLGSWITFKVRSTTNLAIRSADHSFVGEEALMGSARSFYPLSLLLAEGANKLPASAIINDGFRSTVGELFYYRLPDVPYYKDEFDNRILYSEIAINNAFKNGYRTFYSTNFEDYKKEYGKITKILELSGNILVVFEKAVGIIPVNERSLASESDGGNVYINTNKILPNTPQILSDTFGSLWKESIIKTPYYVYGVDTRAKKIWRTNGSNFEIISDIKVNKFLVDNIYLEELEVDSIIGIKNIKTHYNANKSTVIFTFYNCKDGIDEKAWSLGYDELKLIFVTFYSWIPSYSENIQNQFWTFDRETSKDIAKLGMSNYNSTNAHGVVLENNIATHLPVKIVGVSEIPIIENNSYLDTIFLYELLPDNLGMYKHFKIIKQPGTKYVLLNYYSPSLDYTITVEEYNNLPDYEKRNYIAIFEEGSGQETLYFLELNSDCSIDDLFKYKYVDDSQEETNVIYLNINAKVAYVLKDELDRVKNYIQLKNIQSSVAIKKPNSTLNHNFWSHGKAGLYNRDEIRPTFWYGKQHPFEFEFVVNKETSVQKIFYNLQIISNKAEPESFHFEVVGESYKFAEDKPNMYYRQEALKELCSKLGYNIEYDKNYEKITPRHFTNDLYMSEVYGKANRVLKSTIFPLYYFRNDSYNHLYDTYMKMNWESRNSKLGSYYGLTGSEISRNIDLNEWSVITHVQNLPLNKYGRRKGNSFYKEDQWYVQIPSIYFKQKNEDKWKLPPINLQYLPKDKTTDLVDFNIKVFPEKYLKLYNETHDVNKLIDLSDWKDDYQTRLRDKYIKIRIRYSGKELAIINSIITLFNYSYA